MRVTICLDGSEAVVLHAEAGAEEPPAAVRAERSADEQDVSAGEAAVIGLLVGLVVAVLCEIPFGLIAMETGHVEMMVGPGLMLILAGEAATMAWVFSLAPRRLFERPARVSKALRSR